MKGSVFITLIIVFVCFSCRNSSNQASGFVFPEADLKVFMTANPEVRAKRRYKELKEKGVETNFEAVKKNIEKRDYIDSNRKISPLKKATDAIVLDNSNMTVQGQMKWFEELLSKLNYED